MFDISYPRKPKNKIFIIFILFDRAQSTLIPIFRNDIIEQVSNGWMDPSNVLVVVLFHSLSTMTFPFLSTLSPPPRNTGVCTVKRSSSVFVN